MQIVRKILIVLILIGGLTVKVQAVEAPQRTLEDYTPQELVQYFAEQYNVSADNMLTTMFCESSFNPEAVGDGGNSYGLSQIHLPSWKGTITKEQALDPVFVTEFMAKQFAEDKEYLWTCARINGIV